MKKEIVIVHLPNKAPQELRTATVVAVRKRLGSNYIVAGLLTYEDDFRIEVFYRQNGNMPRLIPAVNTEGLAIDVEIGNSKNKRKRL